MNDLISRQDVLDVLRNLSFDYMFQCGEYYGEDQRQLTIINARKAIDVIEAMPSAELERTAKVNNQIFNNSNPYTVGAWLGICECGELVSYTSKYCHMCGAKLDWSGNE